MEALCCYWSSEGRRGSWSRRLGPADGGSYVSGQGTRAFVYEDLLKGFNKEDGGYSQICILGSFWRLHWKEGSLEGENQLGGKCHGLR